MLVKFFAVHGIESVREHSRRAGVRLSCLTQVSLKLGTEFQTSESQIYLSPPVSIQVQRVKYGRPLLVCGSFRQTRATVGQLTTLLWRPLHRWTRPSWRCGDASHALAAALSVFWLFGAIRSCSRVVRLAAASRLAAAVHCIVRRCRALRPGHHSAPSTAQSTRSSTTWRRASS